MHVNDEYNNRIKEDDLETMQDPVDAPLPENPVTNRVE